MNKRQPRRAKAGPDWKAAEAYGCDMSLIESNLRKTPAEGIRDHSRALAMATALCKGMKRKMRR
ncbi:MAG: hypothetical protein FJ388_02155 [Verrucomicrobia bacterium]|nr:hypothetical protein [Verrucomicrobiota bacterium]